MEDLQRGLVQPCSVFPDLQHPRLAPWHSGCLSSWPLPKTLKLRAPGGGGSQGVGKARQSPIVRGDLWRGGLWENPCWPASTAALNAGLRIPASSLLIFYWKFEDDSNFSCHDKVGLLGNFSACLWICFRSSSPTHEAPGWAPPPETHSAQTTNCCLHRACCHAQWPGSQVTQHLAVPPPEPQRGPCPLQLTILTVVEHDKLLPAQFCHQPEHDVIEAHRRSRGQCVGFPIRAGVQVAGGAWWPPWVALDKEVWDMHRVCEGLQGVGRCTAGGCDQGQNPLGHEVTG